MGLSRATLAAGDATGLSRATLAAGDAVTQKFRWILSSWKTGMGRLTGRSLENVQ
jgi:hypothetical protein